MMDRDELKKTIDRCIPSIRKTALNDIRDPFAGIFWAAAFILSRWPYFTKDFFTPSGYECVESNLEQLAANSINALAQIRSMIGEGLVLNDYSFSFYQQSQREALNYIVQQLTKNGFLEGNEDQINQLKEEAQ